jgi:hypothetical protein
VEEHLHESELTVIVADEPGELDDNGAVYHFLTGSGALQGSLTAAIADNPDGAERRALPGGGEAWAVPLNASAYHIDMLLIPAAGWVPRNIVAALHEAESRRLSYSTEADAGEGENDVD